MTLFLNSGSSGKLRPPLPPVAGFFRAADHLNSPRMPDKSKQKADKKKIQPKSAVASPGKEERKETGRGKSRR
jgi:hypothetical protein